MKDRIFAQLTALGCLLDQDPKLSAIDRARLESRLEQWGRDYTHAHGLADRGIVEPTEEERQAKAQGGFDAGRRLTVVSG